MAFFLVRRRKDTKPPSENSFECQSKHSGLVINKLIFLSFLPCLPAAQLANKGFVAFGGKIHFLGLAPLNFGLPDGVWVDWLSQGRHLFEGL